MTLTDGRLKDEDLKYIDSLILANASFYNKMERYTLGNNPGLMDEPAKNDPDNRVPVPIAGKIVTMLAGYGAKPGNIRYSSPDENYTASLKEIFDSNDEELLTNEVYTDALTFGVGYELAKMVDGDTTHKLYRLDPRCCYPVFDDTLDKKLISFIYQVSSVDFAGKITYKRIVFYSDVYIEYEKAGQGDWSFIAEYDHPFGSVPVSVYYTSTMRLPAFYKVISLIDQHDKTTSANANERDRFANAYIRSLKHISDIVDDDGKSDLEKLTELRIFEGLGDFNDIKDVSGAIDFMVKPSRTGEAINEADRYERLIYDQSMVPNLSDVKEASGNALMIRLQPMELVTASMLAYFQRGLQNRINLIQDAELQLKRLTERIPVTITFTRNQFTDISALAITANDLKGIWSDKTILKLFPADYIPDVQEELENLSEQGSGDLPL